MSITFSEALQTLPALSSARVAAGQNGLDRVIRWTHIVDHSEVLSWVREGDLLLTTAFAMKDNPGSELVMIEQLAEKGIAGILISIGRYIFEVPPETIAAANKNNFPIVTIPWEVPLAEVTQAIHERIISKQYELTEQIYHIHKVLSELVLEGGGLNALARRVSEFLQCSVTIEDSALQLQAYASVEPVDEVRQKSIEQGATPKEVIDHLSAAGLFETLKNDPKPQFVPTNPSIGMTLDRIIAPIMVGDDLYGYIWIIASQNALRELDMLALERAAHIAALIINREQSVYAAEQRIKTRLFENLMNPYNAQTPHGLQEIIHQLGLHNDFQVITIGLKQPHPARHSQIVRMGEKMLEGNQIAGTIFEWGQSVVMIINASSEEHTVKLIKSLLLEGAKNGIMLSAGISAPAAEASRVRDCYDQAMRALKTGEALNLRNGSIWQYTQMGYFTWLQDMPSELRQNNPYFKLVNHIDLHDHEHDSQYLNTLETYLDFHLNAANTSKALFIHRNTLVKRLNKMQDLWGIDFEDSFLLINLQLAIKDWRLNH